MDINGLAGSEDGLSKIVEIIDSSSNGYGMEISYAKAKIMTTNGNYIIYIIYIFTRSN